jgi:uncharacterized membrane protein YkoI
MFRALLFCIAVALSCSAATPVPQAPPSQDAGEKAIERVPPKVVPLTEVLAVVRRIAPGKVIDVELEYDVDFDDEHPDARWVYEVEVLTTDNRVVELEFDAETGQLLEIEGAPWPRDLPKPAR